MLQLQASPPSATILWPDAKTVTKRVLSNTSTPLFRDGHIYSARTSGGLVCLDAVTGNELWHDDRVTAPKQGSALHITVNRDGAFIFNDQGELIRAMLTPQGYVEISRTQLITPEQLFGGKKVTWSAPSYADRKIFVRNQQEMVCASLAAEK
jgi:outer membrane protein assembly factor BamB